MLAHNLLCVVCLYIRALLDIEAVVHGPGIRDFDVTYVPPSISHLFDLPLPLSSLPSNDSSLIKELDGVEFHLTVTAGLPAQKSLRQWLIPPFQDPWYPTTIACLNHHHLELSDLPLPVFPPSRVTLQRFSLSLSGTDKMLERRLASSEPGNGHGNTYVGSAVPDPLLDDLLSSAQNGDFHSTGNCRSQPTWNCLSLTIIDHLLVLNHRGGTLSMSPMKRRFLLQKPAGCLSGSVHHGRPFSMTGPAGVMLSWTSPNTFSPPVDPKNVSSALDCQDVQRSSPSVLLLDAQPSWTTQLDSLPLSVNAQLEDCGRNSAWVQAKGH